MLNLNNNRECGVIRVVALPASRPCQEPDPLSIFSIHITPCERLPLSCPSRGSHYWATAKKENHPPGPTDI